MTVPAKPSSNRARWLPTAVITAACAFTVIGCGGNGPAPKASAGSRSPVAPAARTACSPWAGLDDLSNVTVWLRQMIGDEVIFGAGTAAAKRDGLAVVVYAQSLGAESQNLPAPYSAELRASVLPVAASPYK